MNNLGGIFDEHDQRKMYSDYSDASDRFDKIKAAKPTYPTPIMKMESIYSKRTKFSLSAADKATKRVIAPYVRIVRRGQKIGKVEKKEENKQFRFYLQRKPSVLMRSLSAFLSDSVDLLSVLNETADVLKVVTKAKGVTLYMADLAAGEIYQNPRNVINERHKVNWKIEPGKTVAAYVAYHKEYIMVDDVLGDSRFPEGVGYKDETIKSILCVPVVTPDDDCYAIIELHRDVTQPVFAKEDLKIVIVVTGWLGAAIHQNQQRIALQKQQELNDYLLDLTKCYFADTVAMEKMISEVVKFAKVTVGAEHGSFYIIDKDSEQLVANAFEEGLDDSGEEMLLKKNLKINFSQDGGGIPGYVARTCEVVNIPDAYVDSRFNREADDRGQHKTRAILCMPIMGINGILGVVQVINKKNGVSFSSTDQDLLHTFSLYCGLALQYSRLNNKMFKTAKTNECYVNLLQYHLKPCIHDSESFAEQPLMDELPPNFNTFAWYITTDLTPVMPQLILHMFMEVVGEPEIQLNHMCEFILSARKCYRDNPYHCFEHAFNVCHCMYNMVRRNLDIFTPLEVKALIVSALCHDLDHKGFTNNFLLLTNDTLTQLYEESYLENHHYLVTMTILGDCKIFTTVTPEDFKFFSKEIKELILATDLATYFRSRTKLIQIMHENIFDWDNTVHRKLLKSLMMTACDLSGQCKEFNVGKKLVDCLYKEFYNQGDIEKSMDVCPLSMMDRDKQYTIPEDQIQFISVVVMPCMELVWLALSNTSEMFSLCTKLRETWKEIIELRGLKCWRQDDSIVSPDEL